MLKLATPAVAVKQIMLYYQSGIVNTSFVAGVYLFADFCTALTVLLCSFFGLQRLERRSIGKIAHLVVLTGARPVGKSQHHPPQRTVDCQGQ